MVSRWITALTPPAVEPLSVVAGAGLSRPLPRSFRVLCPRVGTGRDAKERRRWPAIVARASSLYRRLNSMDDPARLFWFWPIKRNDPLPDWEKDCRSRLEVLRGAFR